MTLPTRISFSLTGGNEPMIFSAYYSNSESIREFHKNGTLLKSANNVSVVNAGLFKFPNSPWTQGDYTVGEIVVIRNTMSPDLRQQMEGYLAQKWNLTGKLSEQHPYLSVFPNIVVRDFNQQVITDFAVTKKEDNSSLFIRFTPEKAPNKYTISINRGLGIDQNGMTNESASVSFAYGRPVTRLDALTAWWSFDDQNQSYVTDYYGRFNGIFVDNETTDPDTQEVTNHEVTYSDGIFWLGFKFPRKCLGPNFRISQWPGYFWKQSKNHIFLAQG